MEKKERRLSEAVERESFMGCTGKRYSAPAAAGNDGHVQQNQSLFGLLLLALQYLILNSAIKASQNQEIHHTISIHQNTSVSARHVPLPILIPTLITPPQTPMRPHLHLTTPILSLPHYIQQQRTLSLYRAIQRSLRKLPRTAAASSQRAELSRFARAEFERNRHVEDLGQIRYLVSMGRAEFESVRRYVEGMGGEGGKTLMGR
jgi:hypothetical protein